MSVYSPPYVDRIWLWVIHDKIPIYPIFYLLKEDYSSKNLTVLKTCVLNEGRLVSLL